MSETPETPEVAALPEGQASGNAWPPLRVGLYAILVVLVVLFAFLMFRDSALRQSIPEIPSDATRIGGR